MITSQGRLFIGILALQGAFIEHAHLLQRLSLPPGTIEVVYVRTPDDLQQCDALVIPGGESTTLITLLRGSQLLEDLRAFISAKPVWGTCAGAILLSQIVEGGKAVPGGDSTEVHQGLFEEVALPLRIRRNGWGSQVESFSGYLHITAPNFSGATNGQTDFEGVFIRAPVIVKILDEAVQVIARIDSNFLPDLQNADPDASCIVAVRSGNKFLTTFHPELTQDTRIHEWWVRECVLPMIQAR